MNQNKDNSNLQSNSEGNFKHVNPPSEEKENHESEQTIEPDNETNSPTKEKENHGSEQTIEPDYEDSISKYSSVETKGPRLKSWLLLLILSIGLGAGFYFYAYKKDSSFSKILSKGLRKSFPPVSQNNNLPENELKKIPVNSQKVTEGIEGSVFPESQPKEIIGRTSKNVVDKINGAISPDNQTKKSSIKLPEKIVEESKRANVFDDIITEKDKTINLLRNEILSLKSDLKQKSSTPEKFRIKKPHISGSFLEEEPKKTNPQKKKKAVSKTIISSAVSLPANELLNQQSHLQKKSPLKRSEEVKTYLNFVESAGKKFIALIEEGSSRLRGLVSEYLK